MRAELPEIAQANYPELFFPDVVTQHVPGQRASHDVALYASRYGELKIEWHGRSIVQPLQSRAGEKMQPGRQHMDDVAGPAHE